ncbi:MAG: 6-hydroxymethylpterin diphosphokinase MptE-like protein [Campylobacterota bacterium]|nr:6-hydroxymethylpterin diphosphokinase MptE-like protein [Campylobacterota bacterium]
MTLQKKVVQTYTTNLKVIEVVDKELYNRIIGLDELISHNEYQPRYELEYIQEIDEFDILDTVTQSYLYNRQPDKFIKEAIKNTNFDKLNSIDTFDKNYYNYDQKKDLSSVKNEIRKYEYQAHNDIVDYTRIFNSSTDDPNKKFKYLEKFTFIGILLGTHILKIDKKINSNSYFIAEANLEIFRLSLFCTNYFEIVNKKRVVFSIMDDRDIFVDKFCDFLYENFKENYIIKYYSSNYNIQDYFERILDSIGRINPFAYSYPVMLNSLLRTTYNNIHNGYKTLNTKENHTFLNNKPVLFLAAGPSLEKNINWIKENKGKYFIVAIGATIKKLVQNNILPDIISTVDAQQLVENHFPESIMDKIIDIPLVASQITHENVLDKFNNIYLFEVMSTIKSTSREIAGASVGESTFLLTYILGAKKIYMIGADLALDQDTGSTHSDDYMHNKTHNIVNIDNANSFVETGNYSLRDTTILVKGNFRDIVTTTTIFNSSLIVYNSMIKDIVTNDKILKVYNLSDGAYINYTIPIKTENINTENNLFKNINETSVFLNSISSKYFTSEEKINIQQSVSHVEEILSDIEKFQKIKIKKYQQFLTQRETLFSKIIDDSKLYTNLYLPNIFIQYVLIIEPYLAYHFNVGVHHEPKAIKDVKKIWCEQLQRLCNEYKEIIRKII